MMATDLVRQSEGPPGENTRRGRPRFHQATTVTKMTATIAAQLRTAAEEQGWI
jgi:hypothetical protein